MSADAKLGMDGALYYNAAEYEDPDWQEFTNVKDASLNLKKGEADVTTRANDGWKALIGTLKEAEVTFQMVNDGGSDLSLVRTSFLSRRPRVPIEILYLDGDLETSGSTGWRMTTECFNFSHNDALAEAQMIDVSLKPTYSEHAPEFYEVA